jgi:hypothetical protein
VEPFQTSYGKQMMEVETGRHQVFIFEITEKEDHIGAE